MKHLKNKFYKKVFLTAFGLILFGFISCKKFVDTEIPRTLLFTDNVFKDPNSATAAITSIYSQMVNQPLPYFTSLYTGIMGDELKSYSSSQPILELFSNNIQANNTEVLSLWTTYYNYIYQANSVLEGLENTSPISSVIKAQLNGEAKFLRAFCYFNLTNLFGDIPLALSTDYKSNSKIYRSSQPDVYKQIVSDLISAESLLSPNFISFDDTTVTTERIRPNKWAAKTLLSKVYLYTKDYLGCELKASEVINCPLFDTVSIDKVFLKNNKEAIWQLQAITPGINAPEGNNFVLSGPPSTIPTTKQTTTTSSELLSFFESNDLRRAKWIGSIFSGNTQYYFPFKYKIQSGNIISEYSTVFRIGEVYLIRAEARVQQNKLSDGQADLNLIRKRAGLPFTNIISKSALLDAILNDRRVELFTEWGNRWFDLKRTGAIDSVMTSYGSQKGTAWNSTKKLLPIPQSERNNDANLSQNDGY